MTKLASRVYEAMGRAPKLPRTKYNGKTVAGPIATVEEGSPHVVSVRNIDELKEAIGTILIAKNATDAEYDSATDQLIHEGQHRYAAERQLHIAEIGHELAVYRSGIGPFRAYTYSLRTVLPHGVSEPEALYIAAFPEILSTDDKRAMQIGNVGVAAVADYAAAHNLRPPLSLNRP